MCKELTGIGTAAASQPITGEDLMIAESGRGPMTTAGYSRRGGVRWAVLAVALAAPAASAQQTGPAPAKGPVAKTTCAAASFSARQAGSREFRTLAEGADVYPGDLLVGLPNASLETKTGVAVTALADYDGRSPLPVLESAVVLQPATDADLDFTLDRGRVDITNKKSAGPAVVRVRFWDQKWQVTLFEPGDRVAVELYGRWPAGARFRPVAASEVSPPKPNAALLLLVLNGRVEVKLDGVTFGMKAAPGFAQIEWDSVATAKPLPQRLEKLPDWVGDEAARTAEGKKVAEACDKFRKARVENPAAALDAFLRSDNPVERRVAMIALGATDNLERLGKILDEAKNLDEWDFGIVVLRHWMGRAPGQDQALYAGLQSAGGMTPAQARIVLQLLLGFTADDLKRPETYEVLIEYLRHDKSAIRNLAAWHLVRLVPQGKSIRYNPAGTAGDAEAVYKEWKKLIPDGQLPPPGKP
jgi:hypothetical protein